MGLGLALVLLVGFMRLDGLLPKVKCDLDFCGLDFCDLDFCGLEQAKLG